MKCPKCRKPSELRTKRTLAAGRHVQRERVCPRCKERFWTLESFIADIKAEEAENARKIEALEAQKRAVEEERSETWNVLGGLKRLLDRVGGKVR